MGVKTYDTYNTGSNVYYRRGMRTEYPANGPLGVVPPDLVGIPDAVTAVVKFDQMASETNVQAPWTSSSAEDWDSQTLDTWKRQNTTTDSGRFLVDLMSRAVFSAEPRDVSLLYATYYVAAAGNEQNPGNLERLINTPGGAQEKRFVGGSQLIPLRVAKRLGGRVVTGSPVTRISRRNGRVTVVSDKLTVVAQRVIVAVPPPLAARIEYDPPLPAQRDQLMQRMPMGSVMKVHAVYDRPFWRDKGLTGFALSDTGPAQTTFDNTPPSGRPGVLMAFIEASFSRQLDAASTATLKSQVLDNFATYFGDEARSPIGWLEKRWDNDIWHRGCPVCYTAPGVLLDYGPHLRAPVGRVKWAGTETAEYWTGYIDGALRAGSRAAAEALAG
jgi:monoamine oxidase